ncbi:MAG: chromate efflux transporter [Litorivicinaceae bacterium]
MIPHIFWTFLTLGCTAFGGPMAHLALFRREFVTQRHWISDADYSQLVALCQLIPGPASSQVGMALGYRQGGLAGACAAFLGFTLPSAILMGLAGWAWIAGLGVDTKTLVTALKCVAVAVIADAALGLWRSLCQTPATKLVALLSMGCFVSLSHPLAPLGIIGLAFAAALLTPGSSPSAVPDKPMAGSGMLGWLSLIGGLGMLLWFLSHWVATPLTALVWGLYQSGALVFGGGHVVLPLLESTVSPPVSADSFLAGYGIAQAMPGPLFTVATFIGAVYPGVDPVLGAILATLCIFLPGALFLMATLPTAMTTMQALQPRLQFVNACVVGLIFAVLIHPVSQTAVIDGITAALAGLGLLMTLVFRQSPLRVVLVVVSAAYGLGAITV